MGITVYDITYARQVVTSDIPSLSREWRTKIQHAIETKLSTRPEVFGIPLRNTLRDYRKLRVGDYRVIFRIELKTIKILAIGHRAGIYATSNKRRD